MERFIIPFNSIGYELRQSASARGRGLPQARRALRTVRRKHVPRVCLVDDGIKPAVFISTCKLVFMADLKCCKEQGECVCI